MAQDKKILVSVGTVLILVLLTLLVVTGLPEEAMEKEVPLGRGVVVESVVEGSALDRAGVLPGDILRGWERLPNPPANRKGASGALESIFDWMWMEEEQGPRGEIRLIGERNGDSKTFFVPLGFGAARVRPQFTDSVLTHYLEGLALIDADQKERAIDSWQEAAEKARSEISSGDDKCWLLLEASEYIRRRLRDPVRSQVLFESVLGQAQHLTARLSALRGLGKSYRDQRKPKEAKISFESALKTLQETGNEGLVFASILVNLASVARWQGDPLLAVELEERAYSIRRREAPGSLEVGQSLINLGGMAMERGNWEEAEAHLSDALVIQRALAPDSLQEAAILINLGGIAWRRGDYLASEGLLIDALRIRHSQRPESLAVATVLSLLGNVAQDQGSWRLAFDRHSEALRLRQAHAPDGKEVAESFTNLGVVYHTTGDLIQAEAKYRSAIDILAKVAPKSTDLATALSNLATVALDRGHLERARDLFVQAFEIRERLAPSSPDLAVGLSYLGEVSHRMGDLEAARDYFKRALQIRELQAPDSMPVAQSLHDVGMLALEMGELLHASEHLRRALEIRQARAPLSLATAKSLHSVGELESALDNLDSALSYFRQALALCQQVAPGSLEEAETLHGIGRVLQEQGLRSSALDMYLAALRALSIQFQRLGGSYTQKALFRSHYKDYYRRAIELLLRLGDDRKAFEVLERWRAQSFLTLVSERGVDLPSESDPELELERQRLSAQYDRVQRELADLDESNEAPRIEELLRRLRGLRDSLDEIASKMRVSGTTRGTWHASETLDFDGVREALDPGTVLLSYFVMEEQTLLFVLGADGQLTLTRLPEGEGTLRRQIQDFRESIDRALPGDTSGALQQVSVLGRRLYRTLIWSIEPTLRSAERILILTDGPLRLLPWSALVRTTEGSNGEPSSDWEYFVEWKPFHTALSATVFAELKRERKGNRGLQVTAFGDPFYPPSRKERESLMGSDAQLRSTIERGLFNWQSLPASREEVESIAALFPPGRAATFLGQEATEEAVKGVRFDPRLGSGILHVAAHARLDDRLPQNSALVLSLPRTLDEEQDNGLLQVWEIYEEMRLDADLVVLSACETALGKDLGGEGQIGLTLAFESAGARSVMASLWKVKDRATSELMTHFYRHLQEGLSKDRALQAAQIEMIRGSNGLMDSTVPYNWAAFQIDGDWR